MYSSNDAEWHEDQFCPRIVKIGAILGYFWPLQSLDVYFYFLTSNFWRVVSFFVLTNFCQTSFFFLSFFWQSRESTVGEWAVLGESYSQPYSVNGPKNSPCVRGIIFLSLREEATKRREPYPPNRTNLTVLGDIPTNRLFRTPGVLLFVVFQKTL